MNPIKFLVLLAMLRDAANDLPKSAYSIDRAVYEMTHEKLGKNHCPDPACPCNESFEDFHVNCEKTRRKIRAERALYAPKGKG